MHPCSQNEADLLSACDVRSERRSGPGGQHRNKVETAIVIAHQPTGIVAEANERRSQLDNRRVAVFRLRLALATRHRTPSANAGPSELWKSRAHNRRLAVSSEHDDFPALLAELLDQLHATEYSMPDAAEFFQVTASQLVKLLKLHSPAHLHVNSARLERGLHKLS